MKKLFPTMSLTLLALTALPGDSLANGHARVLRVPAPVLAPAPAPVRQRQFVETFQRITTVEEVPLAQAAPAPACSYPAAALAGEEFVDTGSVAFRGRVRGVVPAGAAVVPGSVAVRAPGVRVGVGVAPRFAPVAGRGFVGANRVGAFDGPRNQVGRGR